MIINNRTAKLVRMNFSVCFDTAVNREIHLEKVLFRQTRMIVNALEGTRRSCIETSSEKSECRSRNKRAHHRRREESRPVCPFRRRDQVGSRSWRQQRGRHPDGSVHMERILHHQLPRGARQGPQRGIQRHQRLHDHHRSYTNDQVVSTIMQADPRGSPRHHPDFNRRSCCPHARHSELEQEVARWSFPPRAASGHSLRGHHWIQGCLRGG
jgi:hypothetical protein